MIAMAAVCDVLAEDNEAARRKLGRLLAVKPGYDAASFLRAFRFQRDSDIAVIELAFSRLARMH